MIVKNISPDARTLFTPDAPPLASGDEATVSDERGTGLAWPKSTWEVVEPPKDCDDASTDDAWLFLPAAPKPQTRGKKES